MKVKKLMALLLAGVMCIGAAAGCTPINAEPEEEQTSEAYQGKLTMLCGTKDEFLSYLDQSARSYAEARGCELDTIDCGESIDTQIQYVSAAVSEGAKAIIIITADNTRTQDLIDAAGDVPLVFVNRCPADTSLLDETHVYIGSNEMESGAFQGEALVQYAKAAGKDELRYLMFKGNEGHDSTINRSEGVLKALKDAGITATPVTDPITCDFSRNTAIQKMDSLLADGLDMSTVDAIISNNDAMALGAIESCEQAGVDMENIAVVGVDGINDALRAIAEGKMLCTVYQNAPAQASAGVQAAINLAGGQDAFANIGYDTDPDNSSIIWIPFELITAENISDHY